MYSSTSTRHKAGFRSPRARRAFRATKHALAMLPLFVAALIVVAPVWWTVVSSLRPATSSFSLPPEWIPLHPDWSNYADVFKTVPFGRYLLNSIIVSVSVVVGQIVTATLAGYAFARIDFPGKTILFWLIMATMMIPLQATIIPVFVLISKMHLNNTLASLIVPALPTAFGTFLMRQYFLGISNEYAEAAVIDGANQLQVFARIYAPLAVPGMAILGILTFGGTWNDYYRPLIFLTDLQTYTVPVGIVSLFGYLSTGNMATVLAGVVLSVSSVLIVYLFGQRYLIEGLTVGGLKS